jgi:hypothetical protein
VWTVLKAFSGVSAPHDDVTLVAVQVD